MASLTNIYIKKETLETLLKTLETKNEKGVSITVSLNDDENQYNQNAYAFISQSKEDRDAKKDKYYVGNGRTFWTDGKCTKFDYKSQTETNQDNPKDDLPF